MFKNKTCRAVLSLSASLLLGICAVTVLSHGKTIGAYAVKAYRTGTQWELKLLGDWLWPTRHTLKPDTPTSQSPD
ncbi:MAG: hypothetical protein HQ567_24810 [Candidatus Nealsonbacteria bacterium]|nr:hypothetical protein [Candidatus Nealsonbacteria bacterium]